MLVQVSRDGGSDVRNDEFLKTLCNDGCKSNWAEVIQAAHCVLLWYRDDGGCFKAGRNFGLLEREVEDGGENLC